MKSSPLFRAAALSLVVGLSAPAAFAQQKPCQPPALTASHGPNIFTPRQEVELGDAVAEHVQRNFRVIEDEEVVGYLRRVGDRLVKQLPESEMRYQFFVFDLPVANAFALPGGRIYVSRKLIAYARSEDELAGVLAHELGHIATGQTAADMTRLFREVLSVTEVKDRADIFEKYNQLVENTARKPEAFGRGDKHEEKEQLEADRLALYAMSAAGYDPQAFATFWDRFAETKGKTGGFFSDLFGATRAESRRLREILKGLATLPAECIPARVAGTAEEFQAWQAAVINYSGLGRKEALHAVVSKKVLDPPLRGDITHLRFSPDGKYVLAQDDSGINVLTREPFEPLFRIEAAEAHPAQFTPDSKQVVFHGRTLRVEAWDIESQKQTSVRELFVRQNCMQTALAPDGKTLACLGSDFALTLTDVASGEPVFKKKDFYKPDFADLITLILMSILEEGDAARLGHEWVSMKFTPDAHYFAVGQRGLNFTAIGTISEDASALVYDLTTKATVKTGGQLKKLLSNKFTFLAPDRLLGINPEDYRKSAVVSFPAGEVIEQVALGGSPEAAASGQYVLLRPIQGYAVGVYDLAAKKIFMANKTPALDVYNDQFVSERKDGEVGLYKVGGTSELVAKVVMPRNPLGRLRAAAVSPDLKWLAVSERSRGAVWDLAKGERVFHVRGFRGAHFEGGTLYADFPKQEPMERNVAHLDLATRAADSGAKVEDDARVSQHGAYLVVVRPTKKGGNFRENVTLEVREARTGTQLWTKQFPKEAPDVSVDPREGALVLSWAVKSGAAKAEIKADPALTSRLSTLGEKEGDYLLKVLDARTGNARGALLVETGKGSFDIEDVAAAGDLVVISDTENRVLVYSLATGAQKGHVFGDRPSISKASNLLSVENERGQLTVYDLGSMSKRDQFTFSSPVALTQFSEDGRRLFVLTANQTAYLLDLGGVAQGN